MSLYSCPKCQSDLTQRVKLAYESGTRSTTQTAMSFGSEGDSATTFGAGTRQTHLAARLAPPQPRRPANAPLVLGVLLWLLGLLSTAAIADAARSGGDETTATAAVLVFLGATMVLFFCGSRLQSSASHYNKHVLPLERDEWERKWICLRCGTVWLPGAGPKWRGP